MSLDLKAALSGAKLVDRLGGGPAASAVLAAALRGLAVFGWDRPAIASRRH